MENTSKALIIAGAILLAILIISLGIIVYRQAAGVANNNGMEEVDIRAFNEKFTQYCGRIKNKREVLDIVEKTIESNAISVHKVGMKYLDNGKELAKIEGIKLQEQFNVFAAHLPNGTIRGNTTVEYGDDGYVSFVCINAISN